MPHTSISCFFKHCLGKYWRLTGRLCLLLFQAPILLGAGFPALSSMNTLWILGVFNFSVCLPLITTSLHQAWIELAKQEEPSRLFSLKYGCEWSCRLVAFLCVPLIADNWISPMVQNISDQLAGQSFALMISALGAVLVLVLVLEQLLWPVVGKCSDQ